MGSVIKFDSCCIWNSICQIKEVIITISQTQKQSSPLQPAEFSMRERKILCQIPQTKLCNMDTEKHFNDSCSILSFHQQSSSAVLLLRTI